MDNEEQVSARTAAAVAANVRRRLERNAAELRDQGWFVLTPEQLQEWRDVQVRTAAQMQVAAS